MNKKSNECEITKLLQLEQKNKGEKYDDILHKNIIKESILESIKQQFKRRYYNISNIQLDFLSETIYNYCVLKYENIDMEKIIEFINYENSKYCNLLAQKEWLALKKDKNIKYIEFVIKKYIKLFKEIMDLIDNVKKEYSL